MSFSKCVKYSPAILVIAFVLSEPVFKSRHLPLPPTVLAESSSTAQGADRIALPEPGRSTARELSTGETHAYEIRLDANQYLHALIEPQGVDAGVTLYGPDGQALVQIECRPYGPTPVSLIAESAGVYRLEVRSLEREQALGRYELKTAEIRQARANDEYRLNAEKACAEAEKLLREWREEASRRAIDKFKDSLPSWRALGERGEEALALKRIGDIYQPFGEYENALAFYKQSLSLSRAMKDPRSEGETLNELSYVYLYLGENRKALRYCTLALKLSQEAGNRRGEAQALNNLGEVQNWSGNLQEALEFYNRALSLWSPLNDRRGQAQTYIYLGYTHSDLGQMKEAFSFYNRALSLWQATLNLRGQAITLTAIGRLYSRMGESQRALSFFERAMRITQSLGDPIEKGRILNGIAYIYDQLGERQKAIDHYNKALSIFRAVGYTNGEASTLYDAGRAYHSLGDNERALDSYQRALSISRAAGDRRLEFSELRELGKVYDSLGDKIKALDSYRKTLAFWRSEKDFRAEVDTLNPIGDIYEERGQPQMALDYYEKALPLSRQAEYPFGEASTLFNIARVERKRGNLISARARMDDALEVVESLRTKVASQDLRVSYFASVRQQYEFYIDLLMQLAREHPSDGYETAAFEVSERARARSLLETLADAHVEVRRHADPALLERERSLRAELNERAERQMRLKDGGSSEAETAALTKEMDELTFQLSEVEAQIRVGSMEATASLQTKPLGLREIQAQVVDDDALLLEYFLGEERSYLWVVAKTSIQSYRLPGRAEIEGAANRVRSLLVAPQRIEGETFITWQERVKTSAEHYWQDASILGKMLTGPVAAQLGTKRLLIVADGALQYISFNALPAAFLDDNREPVPLMLDHEITIQPSASALAAIRSETARRHSPPKTIAVFADPVFERDDSRLKGGGAEASIAREERRDAEVYRALRDVGVTGSGQNIPRLFASRDEAEAIMAQTPAEDRLKAIGFDASKATATSAELGQYRIIHFATHGILDSEHPELSGLVLSLYDDQGKPQDGFLRLNDIYNLDLPAEMVVLSACNTGLGKDVKGEGLVGLVRAFMYAGTTRVVASLWKVDDQATAELMTHFYRQLLEENKSPAAALREAQIAMWRQRSWHAPYFWAAFVLQGEYEGKIEMSAGTHQGTPARLATAVAASLLILFGLYLLNRRMLSGNHRR
jgi:CHAT domain-containing protein/tetratricopeptide (TPR) repeat protein